MTFEVLPEGAEGEATPEKDADVSQTTEAPEGEPQKEGNEAESSPAVTDPDEDSEPKGVQKRIDELTRLRRDAERERDRWRELAEPYLKAKPEPKDEPQEPLKTEADFGYDTAKYTAYLVEQTTKRSEQILKKEIQALVEEQRQAARRRDWDARAAKYARTVKDFNEVFTDATPVSEAMAEVLQDSDEGPAVAYYLGKHPEIAMGISQLNAAQAGRELGKIEAMLVAQKSKPKPVSKAPPPPAKIEGGDPGNVEKDPSKMTDAEFAKWRKKQIANRR